MGYIIMNTGTNISDLPIDSSNSNSSALDPNIISQIVSGISQSSADGSMLLPSRDIPMNTDHIQVDAQTHPNYIPPARKNVQFVEDEEDIIRNYAKKRNLHQSLDGLYSELQIPILIALLYFIFQLPFVKMYIHRIMPFLHQVDGNLNVSGFVIMSGLFGFVFYIIHWILDYI
jgi:hypothetical protein